MQTNLPNGLMKIIYGGFTGDFCKKWKTLTPTEKYYHCKYKDTSIRMLASGGKEFKLTFAVVNGPKVDFLVQNIIATYSPDKVYITDMVLDTIDARTGEKEYFVLCLSEEEDECFKLNNNGVGIDEYYRKLQPIV